MIESGRSYVLAGLLDVGVDEVDVPGDQGVLEPLLDRAPRARPRSLPLVLLARRLDRLGELGQPVGGVGTAVEQHVLDALEQVLGDLLVDLELAGVDDPHVEPGADRVVEERGVHRLADRVVAAVRERDVAHAAGGLALGEDSLQLADGLDELDRVVVVLLDAGADGQDVGVEDDVRGREADLLGQQLVGALADRDLVVGGDGLALLRRRPSRRRRRRSGGRAGPVRGTSPRLP